MEIVVIDTETNGLNGESVLAMGAKKVRYENGKLKDIDTFQRYYYPKEKLNYRAISINGLHYDEISKRRSGATYVEYFDEDEDFENFIEDAEIIVAHRTDFDCKYVTRNGYTPFCTMEENTGIVTTRWDKRRQKYRWPSLKKNL